MSQLRGAATGPVAGIGVAAASPEALDGLFDHVRPGSGVAYVVVLRPTPDSGGAADRLLAREGARRAEDGMEVLPDGIHVVPVGFEAAFRGGRLRLREQGERAPVVDRLFLSLANELGPLAIGIVLSGLGSDGSRGVKAIRRAGGLVLLQDERGARFGEMPAAALATGAADAVLPPAEMGPWIRSFLLRPDAEEGDGAGGPEPLPDRVAEILALVQREKAVDVSHYDPSELLSRLERRMATAGSERHEDYLELLTRSPGELEHLFRHLFVDVSRFFRDAPAFRALGELLGDATALAEDGVLRAWVAGCGTGEEAYSVAMLLDEVAREADGVRGFRVFATDVSSESLAVAGEGWYPSDVRRAIEPGRLEEYFERRSGGYRVARSLRDRVVFASHDVTRDPPFERMHLATCRSLLTYMLPELQERVLRHLRSSLVPGGFLLLGPTEAEGDLAAGFEEVDGRWGIFRKLRDVRFSVPRPPLSPAGDAPPAPAARRPRELERICSAFVSELGAACLVLDGAGRLVQAIGDAEPFVGRAGDDPSADVRRGWNDGARAAVTGAMREARRRGTSSVRPDVSFGCGGVGDRADLRVRRIPAAAEEGARELYLVLLGAPRHERGAAEAALLDLEARAEELRERNEELVAHNEDLFSENEELRSVNRALYAANAEHQKRIEELTELSDDVENLLRSIEVGTVFLDRDLRIRSFTPQAAEIVSLQPSDIGRPIEHLTHRLEGVRLDDVAEDVVRTGRSVERETVDVGGTPRLMRVLPYASSGEIGGAVITFIDISLVREAQESLARSERRFKELVERLDQAFWTTSADGSTVHYVSPLAEELFGLPSDVLLTGVAAWFENAEGEEPRAVRERFLRGIADGGLDLEFRVRAGGDVRWIHAKGFAIPGEGGADGRVVGFARDVTRDKEREAELQDLARRLEGQAHTDVLTGLVNRRGFEAALSRELSRARRGAHSITVVLIDLDDFKSVNDSLGHAVGDAVLHGATERMSRVLRPSDVLARIGGDEFLALLPETRPTEAVSVAERLRLAIADNPITVSGEPLRLTASLGVSPVPLDVVSIEEVVDATREALSAGKRTGKNRVVATTGGARLASPRSEPQLELLLGEGAIRAVCQPIRDLATGEVRGYEMLSRGPEGPYASPNEFLRLSLEKNVLSVVDLKCLRACVLGARALAGDVDVHVNLYPSTLVETPVERIVALLDGAGGFSRFCVELSEELFLGAPAYLSETVRELRRHGVRVAVDDVGYGRSSIEALVLLEPDVIKLAREFVRDADRDDARRAGLERLVRAAAVLSGRLVAEGVEREGERDLLLDLGVGLAQGFLWDRPASPEEVARP